MADELEQILNAEKETQSPALEEKKTKEATQKEEQLANLQKAISEANSELKKIRQETKAIKQATVKTDEEEDVRVIDEKDPASKAWLKRINSEVSPIQGELEKEKEEIRTFAIQEFLADKPALAKDPEKVKTLISTYEALSRGKISERTTEGVRMYLAKAYAAEFSDEVLHQRDEERFRKAKAEEEFSNPGISRGSTTYLSQREIKKQLTQEEQEIAAKWDRSLEQMGIGKK